MICKDVQTPFRDAKTDYVPGLYVVDLVADNNGPIYYPTYNVACESLKACISGKGHFEGWLRQNEQQYLGMAVIRINDLSLIPLLQQEDFVASGQLPFHRKDITLLDDVTVFETNFDDFRL